MPDHTRLDYFSDGPLVHGRGFRVYGRWRGRRLGCRRGRYRDRGRGRWRDRDRGRGRGGGCGRWLCWRWSGEGPEEFVDEAEAAGEGAVFAAGEWPGIEQLNTSQPPRRRPGSQPAWEPANQTAVVAELVRLTYNRTARSLTVEPQFKQSLDDHVPCAVNSSTTPLHERTTTADARAATSVERPRNVR